MFKDILLAACMLILSYSYSSSQSIDEIDKRGIVRIETPDGKLGTGFTLSDSVLGFFLVTNKHVIKSPKTGAYYDSVFVRTNMLDSGKVVATERKNTLYLYFKGHQLFREHKDSNIDLVVIQLGHVKVADSVILNPSNFEWLYGLKMRTVADRGDLDSLQIRDGSFVQIVGFSFQAPQKPQFHISRFGHLALFSYKKIALYFQVPSGDSTIQERSVAEWLVIDIVSRGGDSGGPVFAFHPKNKTTWIIGIVKGSSELNEYCFAHPSYHIWELVRSIADDIR